MAKRKTKQPNPPRKKVQGGKSTQIKAETKDELRNYYLSKSGRSLGYGKTPSKNLSKADQVFRAMDIAGNTHKMIGDFEKSSDKVTSAFKAVRKKK